MTRKFSLFFLFLNLTIYSQNHDLEKIMNLVIKEVIVDDFRYFNLVDKGMVKSFRNAGISNMQKRELLKKDAAFPLELTDFGSEIDTITWTHLNLLKAKFNSANKCKEIIENNKQLIMADSNKKFDSLTKQNSENKIIVRVDKNWNDQQMSKAVNQAYQKEFTGRNREDKVYYEFSKPFFSTNGKYFRITIFEYRLHEEKGSSLIYKLEDNNLIEVLEFNYWRPKTIIAN